MKIQGTNLSMIRGDTESIVVSCIKDNRPYIEDGDIIYFTVKKSVKTEEKLLQKIITIFKDDKALIEIEPQDTKELKYGKYVYDIQLTKFNGEVKTLVHPSNFEIEGEVTYE